MTRTAKILLATGLALAGLGLAGCSTFTSRHPVGNGAVPEPAKMVDLQSYLGRWYEIARYEQGFQRNCEGVTADYSLRPGGGLTTVLPNVMAPRENVVRSSVWVSS